VTRLAILLRLVFFVLCAACCRPALAQTCTVSSTAVAFGNYAPLSGSGVTTTGTITVICNPGAVSIAVTYVIALSIGGGTSYAVRSMGGPTPRLRYQLYKDNAYSQIWGDGSAGTYTVSDGYLLGILFPITKTYTVYGSIAANTACSIGSYTDAVVVTITY
jgi:spore coat protein U-like protein